LVIHRSMPAIDPPASPELQALEPIAVDIDPAFRPPSATTEKVSERMPTPKPFNGESTQEIQAQVEPKPEPRPEPKEVFSSFEPTQSASGGAMKYVAIGAGALVIAGGIGWAVLSTAGDSAASMVAPQTTVQQQQPVAPIEIAPTKAAEPVSVATDTNDTANVSATTKPRAQIADTRTAPPKPTKPAAKNEAKPTKKLTVDDLIN